MSVLRCSCSHLSMLPYVCVRIPTQPLQLLTILRPLKWVCKNWPHTWSICNCIRKNVFSIGTHHSIQQIHSHTSGSAKMRTQIKKQIIYCRCICTSQVEPLESQKDMSRWSVPVCIAWSLCGILRPGDNEMQRRFMSFLSGGPRVVSFVSGAFGSYSQPPIASFD